MTLLSQYCECPACHEVPCAALQDFLFDWLGTSETAADRANLRLVGSLFEKLVKDGLFEYAAYIQRLVAPNIIRAH